MLSFIHWSLTSLLLLPPAGAHLLPSCFHTHPLLPFFHLPWIFPIYKSSAQLQPFLSVFRLSGGSKLNISTHRSRTWIKSMWGIKTNMWLAGATTVCVNFITIVWSVKYFSNYFGFEAKSKQLTGMTQFFHLNVCLWVKRLLTCHKYNLRSLWVYLVVYRSGSKSAGTFRCLHGTLYVYSHWSFLKKQDFQRVSQPPTCLRGSVFQWYSRCSVSSFIILSSTTAWQHIRRGFPLSGFWSVSNRLTLTLCHTFVYISKWLRHDVALQYDILTHLNWSCFSKCEYVGTLAMYGQLACGAIGSERSSNMYKLSKNMWSLVFPPSLHRVTGGELFEDIVAREYYSEADAR